MTGAVGATGGAGGVAPLRQTKKMRKRRELDALVGYGLPGGGGGRRPGAPLLPGGSSDERDSPEAGWGVRRTRPRGRGPAARACAALLLCACATATATVVWLFIDVREQITALRTEMELVSMGSQGVGDALQRCHSVARELQHNHTEMAARLDHLLIRTDNLTSQVLELESALSAVRQQVAGAPELVNVPQQLADLGKSVATQGSQIKDLDSTLTTLRAQTGNTADQQTVLQHNVTNLKGKFEDLYNASMLDKQHQLAGLQDPEFLEKQEALRRQQTELQAGLAQLSSNVSLINQTLATKIHWATQDFQQDHHKVTELLDTVQNNSAALSSLQTAWRGSDQLIARNMSTLKQMISDKSSELSRQVSELRALQQQLSLAQRGSAPSSAAAPALPQAPPTPQATPLAQQDNTIKDLHERDLEKLSTSSALPLTAATKALPSSVEPPAKPIILSGSGAA